MKEKSQTSARVMIRPLGRPGDLGWVVMAHGEIYATEFGWDTTFEVLVAQIVAAYARDGGGSRQAAWIAELDGARAGCVFCVCEQAADGGTPGPGGERGGTAKLRILLVDPRARGHGLGAQLVDRALEFARDAGYERMQLWTNHPLTAARKIYLSRGFALVGEEPHRSFGVDLIGQTYERRLDR